MRDDQIRNRVTITNPWWTAAVARTDPQKWATTDLSLRSRQKFDLGYRAPVLADVAHEPIDDRLIVLRGPRRVGKSVAIKDVIYALCGRPDIDPRQLIYIAADELKAQDLNRAILLSRELTRSVDQPSPRPRAWFIDEVTSLDGWTTTLKFLRDNTAFGLDLVVCTGSSWADNAEVGRDLLAGRAGTSNVRRTRILLPMSFRDFMTATRPEIPCPVPVAPWDLQSPAVAAAAALAELNSDALDLAWQAYLTCGGYPRAVSEYHHGGQVSDAFLTDLEEWLHRDVDSAAPEESIPKLLSELHARSSSPLNRTKTAAELGYGSRQTFDLRLNKLVRTFGAIWCHQVNDDGRHVPGAQAKLYLTDPIMASIGPRLRAGLRAPDMTCLTESALAVALAAVVETYQSGRWAADDAIGYARTGTGLEIDLAPVPLPSPGGDMRTTPIEAKWVTRGWRQEARPIEAKYGRGIVATKNITSTKDVSWALPAPLVALLLQ